MSRSMSQILQANEKAKAWSAMIGNLGTALTIAGVGTLWLNGPQPWPIAWIAFGVAVMNLATQLLNYLEAEADMELIGNIAPIAVPLAVCAIAWLSVRRAYRQCANPPAASQPAVPSAAE